MACACGGDHTITLSDDGTVYSFGRNFYGALGLGHNNDVSLPTPIPNLPKINMVSCGAYFTVCVDHEGFIWSFGENKSGQLGTGNKTNFNIPQKILEVPPVLSVNCGASHTLMITTDSNLWSCGRNDYGQLCLGNTENQLKPQKTTFSNISKISAGFHHSLFQNDKGEIFSCGYNAQGQCGLGHFNDLQITPSLILNVPSNIVQFVCGGGQNLFLDSEGNVYSVGKNYYGQLGLGHNIHQNVLNKIPNIPPIQIISCEFTSSYLLDFKGNLWTFGFGSYGQLGNGDRTNNNAPNIITSLQNIQQISHGSCGFHFFAKNSQNQIFVTGKNDYGQLGTGDRESVSILKEINSQYSTIWGNNQQIINQWQGRMCSETTTIMNWKEEEMEKIEMIQSKIKQVKLNLSYAKTTKLIKNFPKTHLNHGMKWMIFWIKKLKQINSKMNEKQETELKAQKDVQTIRKRIGRYQK